MNQNSFEQFCINWANEKLQQEFNAHVFKLEQEEYKKEQINWTYIDFTDNQACIDVIEGKMGILTLLDEESRLPAGADASFASKLHQQLTKPEHKEVFKKPRFNQNAFTIAHYAHDVTYDVDGFIEKNRDTVPDEHLALLQASSNDFLKEVLDAALAAANTSKPNGDSAGPGKRVGAAMRKPTLGSIFKNSLISLMDTINSTNVHYIRCIKPNEAKRAWELEPNQVLAQLRACGVLETIRISCAGYPSRWTFPEFAERYYVLVPSKEWHGKPDIDAKMLCESILAKTLKEEDKYQIGLTKIFFRAGMLANLEAMRQHRLNELVTVVQKNFRRWIEYRNYQAYRKSVILAQTRWRGILARRHVEELRKQTAAIKIQRVARGWMARKRYQETKQAVIKIQSVIRAYQARFRLLEERKETAVVRLQSLFRGLAVRQRTQAHVRKVVVLQSQWRRKLAIRELRGLKVEAKSASKFKEISYQLENKVVELTQTLQKRTAENKELGSRVKSLERELQSWQGKHEEVHARTRELEAELAKPSVPKTDFEDLLAAKSETEGKMREAAKRVTDQEQEIQRLSDALQLQAQEMETRTFAADTAANRSMEDASVIAGLRSELHQLKEQISRNNALNALSGKRNQNEPPPSPTAGRLKGFENLGVQVPQNGSAQGNAAARKRIRRASGPVTGASAHMRTLSNEEILALKKTGQQNRAVSVMLPSNGTRPRDSNGLPTVYDGGHTEELQRLLEDRQGLDEDILDGLIKELKVPPPSVHSLASEKEIFFPAHLIGTVTNEMWRMGMIQENEGFLGDVVQMIQSHVMVSQGRGHAGSEADGARVTRGKT